MKAPHSHDKRCKSGMVGVSLITNKTKGYLERYYRAVWGPSLNQHVRCFSIKKYGKKQAFNRACDARKNGLKQLKFMY